MTDSTATDTSPAPAVHLDALSTEIRLRALEVRVRGAPASTLSLPAPEDADADTDALTLSHRTTALRAKLDEVAEASPPIKQFLGNYERYAPFLRTLPETDDDAATALAGDTLSPAAKTALVLESRADIVEAEKGLREIDVYNKRGVAGADGLDDIIALKPALKAGTERVATRYTKLEQSRADVASLVGRYNDFTSTVSDMFLALHDQLSSLEEAVTRAERAERDELKRRY